MGAKDEKSFTLNGMRMADELVDFIEENCAFSDWIEGDMSIGDKTRRLRGRTKFSAVWVLVSTRTEEVFFRLVSEKYPEYQL